MCRERDIITTCSQNYKFEGKERDTETNNDDFGARYYSWRFGRFLSSDWSALPAPVPYANLTNPQTLNLYAMVSDNPETFADLDGHLIQGGGPYNLETADISVAGTNCDYIGGDCSQNGFGDENAGIPDWYLSEASAQQYNTHTVTGGAGKTPSILRRIHKTYKWYQFFTKWADEWREAEAVRSELQARTGRLTTWLTKSSTTRSETSIIQFTEYTPKFPGWKTRTYILTHSAQQRKLGAYYREEPL